MLVWVPSAAVEASGKRSRPQPKVLAQDSKHPKQAAAAQAAATEQQLPG
jgi:hypothetical protein